MLKCSYGEPLTPATYKYLTITEKWIYDSNSVCGRPVMSDMYFCKLHQKHCISNSEEMTKKFPQKTSVDSKKVEPDKPSVNSSVSNNESKVVAEEKAPIPISAFPAVAVKATPKVTLHDSMKTSVKKTIKLKPKKIPVMKTAYPPISDFKPLPPLPFISAELEGLITNMSTYVNAYNLALTVPAKITYLNKLLRLMKRNKKTLQNKPKIQEYTNNFDFIKTNLELKSLFLYTYFTWMH